MSDLSELIERVRQATGPDRGLDIAIHSAISKPLPPGHVHGLVPRYTASLDAISALIEKKLPGASWGVRTTMEGAFAADIPFVKLKDMRLNPALARTGPLAMTLAFLLAIQENSRDQ